MTLRPDDCPDCAADTGLDRRGFLKAAGLAAASAALPAGHLLAAPSPTSAAETAVKAFYDSLTEEQRKVVCFDWDHQDPKRGLLRTFVSNNWQITDKPILSPFYTKKQQGIIYDIWKGLTNPEWHERFKQQLKDDTGGKPWGQFQSAALFGKPGDSKFEFVMTGRHMTLRADGNTESSVAFGGPIFYGHAARGFNEAKDHPGNVFWHQALMANKVYQMLDDKQRQKALIADSPKESAVGFRGSEGDIPGLPIGTLTGDVKKELQKVLAALVEPYRTEDKDEALAALSKHGGLDACRLSFFKDDDIGDDGVWDNWRIEGPAFVWYFRGHPHVHVWVNVADDPKVKLNARG
jgi:hypothetical protein